MNNDERIDEIIRGAASEYNRPPSPADDMWMRSRQAESPSRPKLHIAAGGYSTPVADTSLCVVRACSSGRSSCRQLVLESEGEGNDGEVRIGMRPRTAPQVMVTGSLFGNTATRHLQSFQDLQVVVCKQLIPQSTRCSLRPPDERADPPRSESPSDESDCSSRKRQPAAAPAEPGGELQAVSYR